VDASDFTQRDNTALSAFDKSIRKQGGQFLAESPVFSVCAMRCMDRDIMLFALEIENITDFYFNDL